MITFGQPLALLLVIPFVALALFSQRHAYSNLSLGRMRLAMALRVTILLALILSLAGLRLHLSLIHI